MRISLIVLLLITKIILQDGYVSFNNLIQQFTYSQENENNPEAKEIEELKIDVVKSGTKQLKYREHICGRNKQSKNIKTSNSEIKYFACLNYPPLYLVYRSILI